MQRNARLIARLSPGEKLLLLALRRQDGLGEADLLRTLLRQEAVRRAGQDRAPEEIAKALRLIEQEEPKTVGRPPALPREVAPEPEPTPQEAIAPKPVGMPAPQGAAGAGPRVLGRTEHAILVSAVEPKGLPLAHKSKRVLQMVRLMRDEGLLSIETDGDDERAHATEAGKAALWESFNRQRGTMAGARREARA